MLHAGLICFVVCGGWPMLTWLGAPIGSGQNIVADRHARAEGAECQSGTAATECAQPTVVSAVQVVEAKRVRLAKIPDQTALVFHDGGFIYTMDQDGAHITQITFDPPRHWEHVAVSHDRRFVAGDAHGEKPGSVELWVFDLQEGTELRLLPDFLTAGAGGVAWDPEGKLYVAASQAGPPQQFVYRLGSDGSGLTQLTRVNSADVSVSEDGRRVTFMTVCPGGLPGSGADHHTEIWVVDSDGSNAQAVFREGGAMGVASVHDPEFSPDGTRIVFSRVNPAFKNWPDRPGLNTAHDLWIVRRDDGAVRRVTEPGPISVIPNWQGEWIVYCELNEKDDYMGMSLVKTDGTERKRLRPGFGFAKWIPPNRAIPSSPADE